MLYYVYIQCNVRCVMIIVMKCKMLPLCNLKFKARVHIINNEFLPITLYGLHVVGTPRTTTVCAPMYGPAADRVFAVGRWHNNR